MARISNKDKALSYAANKGIILTVEDRDIDGCDSVEVWSLHSHLSERNSYFHNHTHPDCDPAVRHLTGLKHHVGYFTINCNGCGMILRDGADVYGAIRLTNPERVWLCGAEPTDLASELDRDYIAHHTKSRQLMRDCVTHGVIGIEGLRALLEVGTISYRQFKELETLTTQLERN